jgi:hypothetical protein
MRLYVWEGDGISDAYHDDGTLVVLAESPEQAREIALASAAPPQSKDYWDRGDIWRDSHGGYGDEKTPNAAINRAPDRVVELDRPCVVAFNGGGHD